MPERAPLLALAGEVARAGLALCRQGPDFPRRRGLGAGKK